MFSVLILFIVTSSRCLYSLCLFISLFVFLFLMQRPPPRSTLSHTLCPYTTLFRSKLYVRSIINHQKNTKNYKKIIKKWVLRGVGGRSEEHTSELQSLMRISYAVFCLKKKN